MSTTSQRFQRERNLALVMNLLRERGAASRSELANVLRLDRSTLTHLSGELLSVGLIIETDQRPAGARGGRRPRPLALNPERFAALGVDVRADDASWALLRLDGSVREQGELKRREEGGPRWLECVAAATISAVKETRSQASLLGVGVSIPGVVDNGAVRRSVALGLESVRVRPYWESAGAAVLVDNDANCCAWNLATEPGAPQNIVVGQIKLHHGNDGLFSPSGAGIGLAFILNGSIYYGSRGAAGELRGARWTGSMPDQLGLRLREIQRKRGKVHALRELVAETLRNLGVVVSVLDPDCVVIAGDVPSLSGTIDDLLAGELAGSPIAALAAEGTLIVSPADQYPAARGAARMVLDQLFTFESGPKLPPVHRDSAGPNALSHDALGGWLSTVDRLTVGR